MSAVYAANQVDGVIARLKSDYGVWEEEYINHGPKGDGQSAMTKADLVFLSKQIKRLRDAKVRMAATIQDVVSRVDERLGDHA